MNDELLDLSKATREIVVDTGCNWTEAAAKVLQGVRLSKGLRDFLTSTGLGTLARNGLDKPRARPTTRPATNTPDPETLVAQALEPFVPYAALVRVFEVGDTHKRFLDCTADDLSILATSLKKRAAGYTASARFALDAAAECQRMDKATVAELPADILRRLDKNAPW